MELSLVIVIGITIGSIVMAMLNQQIAFLRIFKAQSFLNEEAPVISNHISKLLLSAERFRLHANLSDALSGANPRLTDSPAVLLNFRQPDGTVRAGILSFQNVVDKDEATIFDYTQAVDDTKPMALYYFVIPVSGTLSKPEWAVTDKPTDIDFFVEAGIIRVRLTGPAGEEIIFSGSM